MDGHEAAGYFFRILHHARTWRLLGAFGIISVWPRILVPGCVHRLPIEGAVKQHAPLPPARAASMLEIT